MSMQLIGGGLIEAIFSG